MSKTLKVVVPLLVLAIVSILSLVNGGPGVHPVEAKADAKADALAALPIQNELPEFKSEGRNGGRYVTARRNGALVGADVEVSRKVDGARFRIESIIADTEEAAKAVVQQAIITQLGPGPMPRGSLTKRQIGQECYNSNRKAGPPQGAVTLVARDGRAVTYVQLAVPVTKKNDKFVVPTLTDADMALVEKHALKVLDKLTQKGYTSKSKK